MNRFDQEAWEIKKEQREREKAADAHMERIATASESIAASLAILVERRQMGVKASIPRFTTTMKGFTWDSEPLPEGESPTLEPERKE